MDRRACFVLLLLLQLLAVTSLLHAPLPADASAAAADSDTTAIAAPDAPVVDPLTAGGSCGLPLRSSPHPAQREEELWRRHEEATHDVAVPLPVLLQPAESLTVEHAESAAGDPAVTDAPTRVASAESDKAADVLPDAVPAASDSTLTSAVESAPVAASSAPAKGQPAPAASVAPKKKSKGRPARPASANGKPLVTLVMIIKDEMRSLPATLNSVLGHVDRYCLVDTGSTDGGDQFVLRWFAQHLEPDQWQLHRETFVDFSTTRNLALRLAGNVSEFILFLNGDDRLVGGRAMRAFLEERRHLGGTDEEAMYIVPVRYGGMGAGRSERLSRAANHFVPGWPTDDWAHWRYEGVTHEVYVSQRALQSGIQMLYVPDDGPHAFHIFHDVTYDTPRAKEQRFRLDIELLLKEVAEVPAKPNRPRSLLYLGQSYNNLGEWAEAYRWLNERLAVDYPRRTPVGEDNERSRAAGMAATAAGRMGKGAKEVLRLLRSAHEHCPTAYTLLQLARFHWEQKSDRAAAQRLASQSAQYLSGRRATSVLCPDDQPIVRQQLPKLMDELKRAEAKEKKTKEKKKKK